MSLATPSSGQVTQPRCTVCQAGLKRHEVDRGVCDRCQRPLFDRSGEPPPAPGELPEGY
jgi:hypothetical protein